LTTSDYFFTTSIPLSCAQTTVQMKMGNEIQNVMFLRF